MNPPPAAGSSTAAPPTLPPDITTDAEYFHDLHAGPFRRPFLWMSTLSKEDKCQLYDDVRALLANDDLDGSVQKLLHAAGPGATYLDLGSADEVNSGVNRPLVTHLHTFKVLEDVYNHHRRPPSDPLHLPRLPLTLNYFSADEHQHRFSRLVDLYIVHNNGLLFNPARFVMSLYEVKHGKPDFYAYYPAGNGGTFYDGMHLPDGVRASRSSMQRAVFDAMRSKGLPLPDLPTGVPSGVKDMLYRGPGGVKDLAVVDDDTRKEVESFIKRKNAEGHSGTILHVSLAFEYGVRANTINSGGRQLVTSRQNAQGKRNGLYGTQLSTAITELRQRFENDNIHKNLALDKRFNFSQYDLDEMLQVNLDKYGIIEGPIREHMIAHALAKGCVHEGYERSIAKMAQTGLVTGVWAIDPLELDDNNPFVCAYHWKATTFLIHPECLGLDKVVATALLKKKNKDFLFNVVKGGGCGEPSCPFATLYGAAMWTDPTGQQLALCGGCHSWWRAELPGLQQKGAEAIAKGEVYCIDSRRNYLVDCATCGQPCAGNNTQSSSRDLNKHGYVDSDQEPCCRSCFTNTYNGLDVSPTRFQEMYPSTGADILDRDLLDATSKSLFDVIAANRGDMDTIETAFLNASVSLCHSVAPRPISVSIARHVLHRHVTTNMAPYARARAFIERYMSA